MYWVHPTLQVLKTKQRIGEGTALTAQTSPPPTLEARALTRPDCPYCAIRARTQPLSPFSLPSGDETYLDIFRDFSLMASDDPEKLSRRSHDLHTL